jgi:hypothetical protein
VHSKRQDRAFLRRGRSWPLTLATYTVVVTFARVRRFGPVVGAAAATPATVPSSTPRICPAAVASGARRLSSGLSPIALSIAFNAMWAARRGSPAPPCVPPSSECLRSWRSTPQCGRRRFCVGTSSRGLHVGNEIDVPCPHERLPRIPSFICRTSPRTGDHLRGPSKRAPGPHRIAGRHQPSTDESYLGPHHATNRHETTTD